MAAVSVADVIKLTKRENISAMDGSLPTDSTVSYDLIKALDFPMEGIADTVEDADYHEKSQNLELPPCTPPSFDALSRPTFFNDNGDMKFKKPSTLYEQTSQITQFPSVAAKSKLASSAISNTQFFRSTSSNNSNSSPSENLYRWDASESDFEASLTEEMSNPVKRKQKKKRKLSQLLSQLSDVEMTKLSSEEPGESRKITRCTHCAVTKTPQWREGPQGPKTLCNACGVRYRSGRPLSDYRPAASPTFSSEEPGESHETKRCAHCSVTRTPQWREGPQGPKTLCNACGVRYRSGRPLSNYLPAASPMFSSEEPGEIRETKRCTHCSVMRTSQWREGPQGPKTLCNECGRRYRSGRPLSNYRPEASPTFSSEEPGESRETKRCTHCSVTRTSQWREGPQGPKTLCNACGVGYRSACLFPEYCPAESLTFSSDKPGESRETKRCTQCAVMNTNQWREGPLGPKTLCNACGVRYRSGHLFPDYRPAATTTFSSDKPGESRETKRCTQCAVTKTRQWREGPLGPKTLCNACGVRYRCRRLFQPYRPPASPAVSLKEPAASPPVSSKEPAASPTVSSKEPRESRGTKQCTHCAATKTPQWREGPQGRMTLCNACGVRYRSGRLFPEYRPAASPTFIASEHSNSHRKVIELRNKDCQGD